MFYLRPELSYCESRIKRCGREKDLMNQAGEKLFTRKDAGLLAAVLLVAGAAALFFGLPGRAQGELVRITVDGRLYGEYELARDRNIRVEEGTHYNEVVIRDKKVYVAEADCPDRYCVKHHEITKSMETIVCLPHRMVVEIVNVGATKWSAETDGIWESGSHGKPGDAGKPGGFENIDGYTE